MATEHQSFERQGILWTPLETVTETSEGGMYEWEKTTAVWSGFGPAPIWPTETRTFLWHKRQVRDFAGKQLAKPRYV